METHQTLQGIGWLSGEVESSLALAYDALEEYLRDAQRADGAADTASQHCADSPLQQCLDYFHQVQGSLKIAQCEGGAILVAEMEAVVNALSTNSLGNPGEACEVLVQGINSVPGYLKQLVAGGSAHPTSLVTMLNDLRAVRGEHLFTESVSFTPNLDILDAADVAALVPNPEALRDLVKKLRKMYQAALLGLIKAKSTDNHLKNLEKVTARLRELCSGTAREQLWRTAGAFVEGLFHLSIPWSSASRFLLRELDKEIRLLADKGAAAFDEPFPRQLLNNLLYYVAASGAETPRIQTVCQAFNLQAALPSAHNTDTADSGESSAWLDNQLIEAVSNGLIQELESVKDLVEEFIASAGVNAGSLRQTLSYLKRIADTLAMVSQFSLRQATLSIIEVIEELVDGNGGEMDTLASLIMDLESAVNAWRIHDHPELDAAELPPAQRLEVSRARVKLLQEVIGDIDGVKQSVLAYVSARRDGSVLANTPAELAQIAAVLEMAGLQRCAAIVKACGHYIQNEAVSAAEAPDWRDLDTLADVIASLDHYLADKLAGSTDGNHALLSLAELSISKLGYPVEPPPQIQPRAALAMPAGQARDRGQAATAPQPAPPQEPSFQEPSLQEQQAMDHDEIDPEIREVFVEEAGEVLATLVEYYPRWAADHDDAEALAETRRAFHTLKGSGRMVGASDIGELAWSLENLLNRIIEGRISPTPALLACLGEALGLLPVMVSSFEHSSSDFDRQRVDVLRTLATRLAEGEAVELAAIDAEPAVATGKTDAEPDDDHLLLEIFAKEALGHLDNVRQFVAQQRSKAPFYDHPSPKLQGVLHTLKGSAHMANIEPLAELVTPLERFMREMLNFQVALDPDIVDLLADGVDYSQRIVAGLSNGSGFDAAELDIFKARVHELREKAIGPSLGQGEEPQRGVDPAFLNLIMADGMQRVLDVEATLDAWGHAVDFELTRLQGLSAELRELENGAERAGLAPLAVLTGKLAGCYDSILEKRIAPSAEAMATLLAAHEVLLDMVDAVAAHQEIVAVSESLQAQIAALAASPGMAASDDAANLAAALAQMVLPAEADGEIIELFLQEADELLESMEHTFHQWREAPQDSAPPDSLKRTLHTFKGGARMAGLEALGNVSHDLEAVVIAREKQVAAGSTSAIASMLAYHDVLANGVETIRKAYQQSLKAQVAAEEPSTVSAQPVESSVTATPVEKVEETTSPASSDEADKAAVDEWPSAEILPFTGTYRGLDAAGPSASDAEQQAAAAQEMVKVAAPMLDTLVNLAGETSISRGQVEQHISEFMFSLDEMEATIRRMHDQVRRLGIETDAQVMFRREQIESSDSSEGFDPLEMDRYSQLQQLSRSLLESASDVQDLRDTLVDKARDAESLLLQQSRINTDLQEGLMRTRMVPFSRLVPRLRRIVRQVGNSLGKQVVLRLESIEGEIDRSILERIVPSLEHMIRNAVDHGIESEAERLALGKLPEGTLSLSFAREGGDVLIRLADDGRGLNADAIRAKALSSGLMPEHATYSDQDIYQFIFAPGFSTSSEVTQISGRGVGMDVVNSDVRQLGGSVSIASQRGAGTEFTLRLPFTVSVNRALMIEVGEASYALALSSINGVTRVPPDELMNFYQNPHKKLEYGGEHYEVRYLGSLLSAELRPTLDTAMGQLPLVLIRSEGRNYAVQVDGLIGSREIVVKTLGAQFSRVPGLSGATVLGDGRVVVILDLQALLRDQPVVAPLAPVVVEKVQEADHIPLIMVVDDSVTVRKVTGRFLEREGFRVITAKDGVDAMRVLQDNTPDVMLLDIEMPRMDGFEVARLVRSTQRLKNLPMVMITSRTGEKHRERALAMGVDRYLGKPYQEEVLISTVYEMLRRTAAEAEQAG